MWNLLLAADVNKIWFLIPLAVVISLVYSASRYEMPERILKRAARLCATILGFMAFVFLLLIVLSVGL
jgi:hypothetical protein